MATVRADRRGAQLWVDTDAVAGEQYTYVITAYDRLWNESERSRAVRS